MLHPYSTPEHAGRSVERVVHRIGHHLNPGRPVRATPRVGDWSGALVIELEPARLTAPRRTPKLSTLPNGRSKTEQKQSRKQEKRTMDRFQDKVALITGAASGIGRSVCVRLASEGARIFAMDIDSGGLAETEALVKDAGGDIQVGVFDVTRRAQCFDAVQASVDAFGQLDVLVNVAGIVRFSHSHEMSEEEWNLVHAINISGPFFLSQAAIPHLMESGGNIVNVASNAGLMGQAYTAAYCSSKGALIQLTRSLAMEYMKKGIRINAVAPGGTSTALVQNVRLPEDIDIDLVKRYMGMRGMSHPDEIAGAVAYIASEEASSVHGTTLSIDNGISAG
jgi:meso-butanediol dehydrogenase/(S,S)-butanediol dehydrogenase/diacetyl reductase